MDKKRSTMEWEMGSGSPW